MSRFKVGENGIGSTFGPEEMEAIRMALSGSTLAYGPLRDKFEKEFAAYVGVKHAVSLTSATAGLCMAPQIIGVDQTDEVICTSQSFHATPLGLLARRIPVRFADVEPDTLNIDPESIRKLITPKTRAIFLVHYGGMPCHMDPILELARAHGLRVVEDVAHAPGAQYKGTKTGALGHIGCFSFHSLKNMTTLGEGGMLTTNDDEFARRARKLRSMGTVGKTKPRTPTALGPYPKPEYQYIDHQDGAYDTDFSEIAEVGQNYRMSEVQAAVGSVQLRKLDGFNEKRRANAQYLDRGLSAIEGIRVQPVKEGIKHVYHLYTMFLDPKLGIPHEQFIRCLEQDKGVQIIMRYMPLHLLPEYRYYGHAFGECPVAEKAFFETQINLPMHPEMSRTDMDYVIQSVKEVVAALGAVR